MYDGRIDLHIHSTISDGRNSPAEIVLYAVKEELNAISVTDHNTFQGSLLAKRYAKSSEIIVVIGSEISFNEGDVLVYCIDEPRLKGYASLAEFIDLAHEEGCIVVPAHPYDYTRNSVGDRIYEYRWDAIEGYNGAACVNSNRLALRVAKELGLPAIGNSDAHRLEDIARIYTLVELFETVDEIIESILKNRVRIRISGKYREKENCGIVLQDALY